MLFNHVFIPLTMELQPMSASGWHVSLWTDGKQRQTRSYANAETKCLFFVNVSEANISKFHVLASRWLHRVHQQNQLNPRQRNSHVANHVIIRRAASSQLRPMLQWNQTLRLNTLVTCRIRSAIDGDVIPSGAKPGLNTEGLHRAEPEEPRTSGAC